MFERAPDATSSIRPDIEAKGQPSPDPDGGAPGRSQRGGDEPAGDGGSVGPAKGPSRDGPDRTEPEEDRADGSRGGARPEVAASGDETGGGGKDGVWGTLRKHPIAAGATLLILIVAAAAGILWYLQARHFESTDDAFIDGRPVSVSPEVTGNIVSVPVNDNQVVRPGDLLAEIDPRDYVAAVQQAEAQIAQAQSSIENYRAQVKAQQAQVAQADKQTEEAQAALNFAKDQDSRAQQLVKTGYGTVQNAQQSSSDLQSKTAALDAAVASRVAAERQINVQKAEVKGAEGQFQQALAQKALADANLSRTQLHATVDARVTRLTAAVGNVATPGQALMVLVPLDLWVTANFKETQLSDMRAGQPVDIEIDAYGRTFHGRVDSLQAGSGTAFSLLPAENATGNYVKVVQRVPVKLTFDRLPDVELGPGMSVVPSVTVR